MLNQSFPGGSVVKNLPANAEMWVWSLGREGPLEKEMATHSSILAWEILLTEKPGGLQTVQSLSHVRLIATPWIAACQASLSITNSQSLLKSMSIELVMPSNHLILYRPLLLLPPICPSIRVFSNESTLRMRATDNGVAKESDMT